MNGEGTLGGKKAKKDILEAGNKNFMKSHHIHNLQGKQMKRGRQRTEGMLMAAQNQVPRTVKILSTFLVPLYSKNTQS